MKKNFKIHRKFLKNYLFIYKKLKLINNFLRKFKNYFLILKFKYNKFLKLVIKSEFTQQKNKKNMRNYQILNIIKSLNILIMIKKNPVTIKKIVQNNN